MTFIYGRRLITQKQFTLLTIENTCFVYLLLFNGLFNHYLFYYFCKQFLIETIVHFNDQFLECNIFSIIIYDMTMNSFLSNLESIETIKSIIHRKARIPWKPKLKDQIDFLVIKI